MKNVYFRLQMQVTNVRRDVFYLFLEFFVLYGGQWTVVTGQCDLKWGVLVFVGYVLLQTVIFYFIFFFLKTDGIII